MVLSLNEALAEADVEAACRRFGLGDDLRAAILADYRDRGPALLAACVLAFAVMDDDDGCEDPDHRSAECGADFYVAMRASAPPGGYPVPDDSHDWRASLAHQCDADGIVGADRAYVMSRLAAEGWRAVAVWVERLVGCPGRTKFPPPAAYVRVGCREYARSRLWLRDHRPKALPLSIYAAAG